MGTTSTLPAGSDSDAASAPSESAWEAAYLRFETPEEEIRKFLKRLKWLRVDRLDRDIRVAELFCGRGNGLVALERLGFDRLEGVDLSARLVAKYRGPATCHVADCRSLPFADRSKDLVVIHGGLHHLPHLPDDLEKVLREAWRVLTPGGALAVVEPWMTPLLAVVHRLMRYGWLRRLWPKLDALAVMTEHERVTYENWLSHPQRIRRSFDRFFLPRRQRAAWGKVFYVGGKRELNEFA
jgi:SAM-dependent methyltransferase